MGHPLGVRGEEWIRHVMRHPRQLREGGGPMMKYPHGLTGGGGYTVMRHLQRLRWGMDLLPNSQETSKQENSAACSVGTDFLSAMLHPF